MSSENKVLIAGASGFIGSAVTRAVPDDTDLVTMQRSASGSPTAHSVDFLDGAAVARIIDEERPDTVVQLSWLPIQPGVYAHDDNHRWAQASVAFAETCRDAGVRRFAFAGSVVECGTLSGVITEASTPRPDTVYGEAKMAASDEILALATDSFSPVVPRVFFGFGPDEHPDRLVPAVIRALLARERVALSSGTQIRDYAHVDDIASGIIAAVQSTLEGRVNVGSGQGTAVRDLATTIGRLLDGVDLLDLGARPDGADSAAEWTADIALLRSLGWSPRFDLETGLDDTIRYWNERMQTGREAAEL